jgi:hypothetical protein
MFSLFKDGIGNLKPLKSIDLSTYAKLVQNPDRKEIYTKLYEARNDGNQKTIRAFKKQLSYTTPHCILKWRNLENSEKIEKNFLMFSGYIYFDIDRFPEEFDSIGYKNHLISKLKDVASLITLSASGRGIGILFKVENEITFQNFNDIRNSIKNTYLKDVIVDTNAEDIGRAQFVPYDSNVFVNYSNSVFVEILTNQNVSIEYNTEERANITLNTHINPNYEYKIYGIDQVLNRLQLITPIDVINTIVDFKEIDVVKPYIPRLIIDTKKHKTYYILIHQVYYLNKNVDIDYIFSFIFFINNTRATPKMDFKELKRYFTNVITQIKSTGKIYFKSKIKRVHFNPNCGLNKEEKDTIAKKLNGYYRRNMTITKINNAIDYLLRNNKKVTNSAISKLTGLSISTIRLRKNDNLIDIDYELKLLNQ